MAARWVGLTRKHKKNARHKGRRSTFGEAMHESISALGALGFLATAAAFNFAMYPEALAQVVGIEQSIEGIVPEESTGTALALVEPLPVDEEEVRLLAATAWGEARSEGEDGMRAVAHVMVNRVGDRFGGDLETVILAPKQFSVWNLGDPNRPLVRNPERYATGGIALETWEDAQRIAREVLSGQSVDPTQGALFYHTRAIRPYWSRYGQGRQVIGAHVFYRDVPDRAGNRRAIRARANVTQVAAQGPRAGRVGGIIRNAPLPAPTTTVSEPIAATPAPSPEAAAAIAQLPTSASAGNSF